MGKNGTGRLSSPCLLHRQVPPERHHDVPLGDGLYADLCFVAKCYVKLSFTTKSALYLAVRYKITNFAAE